MTIPKELRALADSAPPGFKTAYVRVARDPASASVLRDILGLVGYDVTVDTIRNWSREQRVSAEVWAANAHLRASDNILRKCPQPDWLPAPWAGPEMTATVVRP